jgi:hypothetical protein
VALWRSPASRSLLAAALGPHQLRTSTFRRSMIGRGLLKMRNRDVDDIFGTVRLGRAGTAALACEIAGVGGAVLRLTLFGTGPACRVSYVRSVASMSSVFEGVRRSGFAWLYRSLSHLVPSLCCPLGRPAHTGCHSSTKAR